MYSAQPTGWTPARPRPAAVRVLDDLHCGGRLQGWLGALLVDRRLNLLQSLPPLFTHPSTTRYACHGIPWASSAGFWRCTPRTASQPYPHASSAPASRALSTADRLCFKPVGMPCLTALAWRRGRSSRTPPTPPAAQPRPQSRTIASPAKVRHMTALPCVSATDIQLSPRAVAVKRC